MKKTYPKVTELRKVTATEADAFSSYLRELTVEELTRVCGKLEGEMRLLFAFGIYTGLRLGDCATMEWGKIDIARGFLQTNPHKTFYPPLLGDQIMLPLA